MNGYYENCHSAKTRKPPKYSFGLKTIYEKPNESSGNGIPVDIRKKLKIIFIIIRFELKKIIAHIIKSCMFFKGTIDKTKYNRQPAYTFGIKSDRSHFKTITPGMFTSFVLLKICTI